MNNTQRGIIFNIQKFSIHDGPGIRTTVFLKGCPLRCRWCHNPESLSRKPELTFFARNCIGCGKCVVVCPKKAITPSPEGNLIEWEFCDHCALCTQTCYAEALVMNGREATIEEVVEEVAKDIPFYRNSNGGVTVSGGEPLAQAEFCLAILEACKAREIHTVLDTSGYAQWKVMERVLEAVDLVLWDLKVMDAERHKKLTGVSNRLILANAKKTGQLGKPIIVRVPLIPGCNDDEENLSAITQFAKGIPSVKEIEILPYHRLGESKYQNLRLDYELEGLQPPKPEEAEHLAGIMRQWGVEVKVGG